MRAADVFFLICIALLGCCALAGYLANLGTKRHFVDMRKRIEGVRGEVAGVWDPVVHLQALERLRAQRDALWVEVVERHQGHKLPLLERIDKELKAAQARYAEERS